MMGDGHDASRSPERNRALALLLLGQAALAGLVMTGCLERRDNDAQAATNPCVACHGSAERAGDELLQSAPPTDLNGASEVSRSGVGAHQIHLVATATHGAVACEACHEVPDAVDTPGHADTAGPAEMSFGGLANRGDRDPAYDPTSGTCSSTYCHRDADAVWTRPRPSDAACGSCHALPPAAPHPQSEQCANCHSTIDEAGAFIEPDTHVNGTVEVIDPTCGTCHGSEASDAPPPDVSGATARTVVGVGAHQVHLSGGQASRPLQCGECHRVPQAVNETGHLDDTPRAEVVLSGVAATAAVQPLWNGAELTCNNTWCHNPTQPVASVSPQWTSVEPLGCDGCHGAPPALPHPPLSDCALCHQNAVDAETIAYPETHVDGLVDVSVPRRCEACHGTAESPAPPAALDGSTETTQRGVGAHQSHLQGSGLAGPVPCAECHVVPDDTLAPGHIDSQPPAEVVFSGVAVTFGAEPEFDGERCANTYCHGGDWGPNLTSGGSLTEPLWTRVDGVQAACGTCHGIPPPSPHPPDALACPDCHTNIRSDFTFIDPSLHVNGRTDF